MKLLGKESREWSPAWKCVFRIFLGIASIVFSAALTYFFLWLLVSALSFYFTAIISDLWSLCPEFWIMLIIIFVLYCLVKAYG